MQWMDSMHLALQLWPFYKEDPSYNHIGTISLAGRQESSITHSSLRSYTSTPRSCSTAHPRCTEKPVVVTSLRMAVKRTCIVSGSCLLQEFWKRMKSLQLASIKLSILLDVERKCLCCVAKMLGGKGFHHESRSENLRQSCHTPSEASFKPYKLWARTRKICAVGYSYEHAYSWSQRCASHSARLNKHRVAASCQKFTQSKIWSYGFYPCITLRSTDLISWKNQYNIQTYRL